MSNISTQKKLMTGNEAIARGFYEAGGVIAASYPGSPTVEILESLKQHDEIYSEFSTNEKVALEVAIGGSFSGVRSMVSMKHVGVNIAADPLMTFTQMPVNGGFLLVTGDDPGLASSQNEQDNRVLGKFASMPIFDPSDSQEAKDFVGVALQISEDFEAPCMLRITSRLCHSNSVVVQKERVEISPKEMINNPDLYCMLPPNSPRQQTFMHDRLDKLSEYASSMGINRLESRNSSTLIVTSGMVYTTLKELDLDVDIWKLGLIYPISAGKARELAARYARVIVLEEMLPFIETELRAMDIACKGKEYFSYTGELGFQEILEGLQKAGVPCAPQVLQKPEETLPRRPLFCAGCPHRPIFDILKKTKIKTIFGDIGCYSMAFLPPFEQSNSIVSMGASLGIIKGAAKALSLGGRKEPLLAVIGDGTFFHSGMTGFINLLHNKKEDENITIIVLDNRTTAMTGGQPNPGSGSYNPADTMQVSIKALLETMGFTRIREIDQFNYEEAAAAIREEIAFSGLSVIIATRPCALHYKIESAPFYVDPAICIGCRTCIKTNCPPLRMKEYEGFDKLKSSIDASMCVGCSICAQVCPVNAIKRMEGEG